MISTNICLSYLASLQHLSKGIEVDLTTATSESRQVDENNVLKGK